MTGDLNSTQIYGWFDKPRQTEPAYDPPHDAPCLICGDPIHAGDIRTISMMWTPEQPPERSYFYRLHRTCHEALARQQQDEIDGVVWDAIEHNGD